MADLKKGLKKAKDKKKSKDKDDLAYTYKGMKEHERDTGEDLQFLGGVVDRGHHRYIDKKHGKKIQSEAAESLEDAREHKKKSKKKKK